VGSYPRILRREISEEEGLQKRSGEDFVYEKKKNKQIDIAFDEKGRPGIVKDPEGGRRTIRRGVEAAAVVEKVEEAANKTEQQENHERNMRGLEIRGVSAQDAKANDSSSSEADESDSSSNDLNIMTKKKSRGRPQPRRRDESKGRKPPKLKATDGSRVVGSQKMLADGRASCSGTSGAPLIAPPALEDRPFGPLEPSETIVEDERALIELHTQLSLLSSNALWTRSVLRAREFQTMLNRTFAMLAEVSDPEVVSKGEMRFFVSVSIIPRVFYGLFL
jgi:hypothetical protein